MSETVKNARREAIEMEVKLVERESSRALREAMKFGSHDDNDDCDEYERLEAEACMLWALADRIRRTRFRSHDPPKCEECGTNYADWPSKLCEVYQAYREHTGTI